jgi:two-component system LytT family response regulator
MADASDAPPILLVDDEELARRKLARFVRELAPSAVLREAASGVEALAALAEFRPRIVFLDVAMPGLNGFEVLDHLPERPFAVVFQTAFDEFALKAFEENACDYLLKPYTRERFAKAFQRALDRSAGAAPPAGDLGATLTAGRRWLEHVCVDERGLRVVIDVQAIEALVSRDHYTCLYHEGRESLTELSLAHLEERLDPQAFQRVHRNAIVRVAAVRSLSTGEGPEVTLASGRKIAVSRRSRAALVARLKGT